MRRESPLVNASRRIDNIDRVTKNQTLQRKGLTSEVAEPTAEEPKSPQMSIHLRRRKWLMRRESPLVNASRRIDNIDRVTKNQKLQRKGLTSEVAEPTAEEPKSPQMSIHLRRRKWLMRRETPLVNASKQISKFETAAKI